VAPQGGIAQVDLAEPLPAMVAAEGREAQEAAADRVKHILLGAADARRRGVRLLERPLAGDGVEGPGLGVLLAAAALVVPTPADHPPRRRVVAERRLIAHPRRDRAALERAALDPGIGRLLRERWIHGDDRDGQR